jgi:hypothetical protein
MHADDTVILGRFRHRERNRQARHEMPGWTAWNSKGIDSSDYCENQRGKRTNCADSSRSKRGDSSTYRTERGISSRLKRRRCAARAHYPFTSRAGGALTLILSSIYLQIMSSDQEILSMAQSLKEAEEGVVEIERLLQEERARNAILEDMIRGGGGQ